MKNTDYDPCHVLNSKRNPKIGIISYGLGNIGALANMLLEIAYEGEFVTDPRTLKEYDLLILPGVGSFDSVVERLHEFKFFAEIKSYVQAGGALLGICAGMQVLFEGSAEGEKKGLSIIEGRFEKFDSTIHDIIDVPHMKWAEVEFDDVFAFKNNTNPNRFYFVHSYFLAAENSFSIGFSRYGNVKFTSAVRKEKVLGFQFHPEKSHRHGKELLKNAIGELIGK
jgi:imidazole glycerol-phosphate synthase subunit HisH